MEKVGELKQVIAMKKVREKMANLDKKELEMITEGIFLKNSGIKKEVMMMMGKSTTCYVSLVCLASSILEGLHDLRHGGLESVRFYPVCIRWHHRSLYSIGLHEMYGVVPFVN
jgi:hypothetical protein